MIKLADKIEVLLIRHPHLRDDDRRLIATIWRGESSEDTLDGFLRQFAEGCYNSPETIRRIRQKLQEKIPELRGKKYLKRHNHVKKWVKEVEEVGDYVNQQKDLWTK